MDRRVRLARNQFHIIDPDPCAIVGSLGASDRTVASVPSFLGNDGRSGVLDVFTGKFPRFNHHYIDFHLLFPTLLDSASNRLEALLRRLL